MKSLAIKPPWIKIVCGLSLTLVAGPLGCTKGSGQDSPGKPATSQPTLVVMSDVKGTIAPCGCTSNPLGGASKLTALMSDLGSPPLVVVGDFAFEGESIEDTRRSQEEGKAKLLAQTYREAGMQAWLPGKIDRTVDSGVWPKRLDLPTLTDDRILKLEKFEVGLLPTASNVEKSIQERATALRAKGAQAVVALTTDSIAQAMKQSWPGIDIVVGAQCAKACPVRQRNGVSFVSAMDRGQQAAVLRFYPATASVDKTASAPASPPNPAATLLFFDGGEAEKKAMQRQVDALTKQREGMAKDSPSLPTLDARLAELASELKQLKEHPPKPPTAAYFAADIIDLDKKRRDDPAVKTRIAAYDSKLCEWSKASFDKITCSQAPQGTASFVGNQACAGCHAEAFAIWKKTKHAHAMETLETAGKQCDLGCIGCHSVGFGKPGGFCKPLEVGALRDVGCESCHGAGSLHAAGKGTIQRIPGEATCQGCHTPDHSDLFVYDKYLPQILGPGHQRKAE